MRSMLGRRLTLEIPLLVSMSVVAATACGPSRAAHEPPAATAASAAPVAPSPVAASAPAPAQSPLVEVAHSTKQWTGVAVSSDGRVFVSYPRWSDDVPVSVAELAKDGSLRPYPDAAWNAYDAKADPGKHFV